MIIFEMESSGRGVDRLASIRPTTLKAFSDLNESRICFLDMRDLSRRWIRYYVDDRRGVQGRSVGNFPTSSESVHVCSSRRLDGEWHNALLYSGWYPRIALHNLSITHRIVRICVASVFKEAVQETYVSSSLRPQGIGVPSSLHSTGLAIDIYNPKYVPSEELARKFAVVMSRLTGCFEVGYYPRRGFFHLGIHPRKRTIFRGK